MGRVWSGLVEAGGQWVGSGLVEAGGQSLCRVPAASVFDVTRPLAQPIETWGLSRTITASLDPGE